MDTHALPESATVRVCTSPLIGPAEHEATQLIDQLRRRALSLAADNVTTASRKDMTLTCICTLQVEISHAPHGPDAANLWLSSLAVPGLAEKVLECRHAGLGPSSAAPCGCSSALNYSPGRTRANPCRPPRCGPSGTCSATRRRAAGPERTGALSHRSITFCRRWQLEFPRPQLPPPRRTPPLTAIPATDFDRPAELLRHRLVDQLLADGRITTAAVEAAFRVVPRHAFVPEAELEAAYADDTVKTKFDDDGTCLSSLSAPWLQALMIEQAALQPGDSVLEIGSGGYQAALLAEVVTHAGRVVTLDIDPDITDRAASCLERTGYDRVAVAMGDGETGCATDAPYAATIVCAQAYDIPPAWTEQLAPGGRLIVPLYLLGQRRTLTFVTDGDRWIATNSIYSGFVDFQGLGAGRRTAHGSGWPTTERP